MTAALTPERKRELRTVTETYITARNAYSDAMRTPQASAFEATAPITNALGAAYHEAECAYNGLFWPEEFLALLDENEKLAAQLEEATTPDIFGDYNGQPTREWGELGDELAEGEVLTIWANKLFSDRYLAAVRVKRDGCDDEIEVQMFNTEAEALAAARPLSGEAPDNG